MRCGIGFWERGEKFSENSPTPSTHSQSPHRAPSGPDRRGHLSQPRTARGTAGPVGRRAVNPSEAEPWGPMRCADGTTQRIHCRGPAPLRGGFGNPAARTVYRCPSAGSLDKSGETLPTIPATGVERIENHCHCAILRMVPKTTVHDGTVPLGGAKGKGTATKSQPSRLRSAARRSLRDPRGRGACPRDRGDPAPVRGAAGASGRHQGGLRRK